MTRGTSKRKSIYVQLFWLLVCASLAAGLVFSGLVALTEYGLDRYYDASDYETRKNQQYIEELQQYVDENHLSVKDTQALRWWAESEKIIAVSIYKDNVLVFDSERWEELEEAGDNAVVVRESEEEGGADAVFEELRDWKTYYRVRFSDGPAQVGIWGQYSYQFYTYAYVSCIIVSFGLFLFLVLFGIHKKMKYIKKLSEEIELLEGGCLDYEITVQGGDELASLAAGLEAMRVSFRSLIQQETQMMQENQKIVTEMSHDLRTPVTTILLYTEILKQGKYRDEARLTEYIEKIDRKARRMKQLTDHLFEYSLVTGTGQVELEAPETYQNLFYDVLSESCGYLRQNGFETEVRVEWSRERLRIYTDYIVRIMDNITSNIIKYADSAKPVVISSMNDGEWIGFMFQNRVREDEETEESTRIGIRSIKSMMEKMRGLCKTEQIGENFYIAVLFPICKNGL